MSRAATPSTSHHPSTSTVQLPREKIAMRAYELWVKRGRPHGTDMQDWIEAEKELKAEAGRTPGSSSGRR